MKVQLKSQLFLIIIGCIIFLASCSGSSDSSTLFGRQKSSPKAITSFNFITPPATGVVDENTKTVTITFEPTNWNVDITSLAPVITHSGTDISPASGIVQDFSVAQIYTVTAKDGTAQAYTVTLTVEEYSLRDTGPAGGLIFYINPSPVTWKYLEAAPASTEWAGKQWGSYHTLVSGTSYAIGDGASNTALIVNAIATSETDRAAQLCNDLEYGGYSDWFLPTAWDLQKMQKNLCSGLDDNNIVFTAVGGFNYIYYSSTEDDAEISVTYNFTANNLGGSHKNNPWNVRAARAF